jgi:REP element-mobilizing transposase RayT
MPCGGGDIGLNVWVENGDILFYISRSGTFDANNTLLKQGRVRLRLTPNPFTENSNFRQELRLQEGSVEISSVGTKIRLWVDVFKPVIHLEMDSRKTVGVTLFYENWRYQDRLLQKGEGQQSSYKWAPPEGTFTGKDSIWTEGDNLLFAHQNPTKTVFDYAVAQQKMDQVKWQMMNPLANLTFGGKIQSKNLKFQTTEDRIYAGTDYRAWVFKTDKPVRKEHIRIALHTEQTPDLSLWKQVLNAIFIHINSKDRERTVRWWENFWQQSYIEADGDEAEITRNYTLFRYMLGCNAYGEVPTKFNGGLFTFDPCFVNKSTVFTPDFRKWGGGTMTAQNQRLVYWPMLKSGDFDMMRSQFDFYLRMLHNAELRSKVYWNHAGACFSEQIENFGLPNPAEYGFKRPEWFDSGVEYNAWLEYEWDTILEFCQMILETKRYNLADISKYVPLIESSLTFFDEHYRYLASRRGRKELDERGHLILYPGSACETYKMANNASSTIAALRRVLETYHPNSEMLKRIPPLPFQQINGKTTISPAKTWERVNNVETPQLYPVFPWRLFGVGQENLQIARNTYWHDPDAKKFRSHIGWKQDNIWAACLGLTDEAARLAKLKLKSGPFRFPAFWGPGFDWAPDHNHGGSGMIGLQEMLIQSVGDTIYLFPAWPPQWNVRFRLCAPGQVVVECELKEGKLISLKIKNGLKKQILLCNDIYNQTNIHLSKVVID